MTEFMEMAKAPVDLMKPRTGKLKGGLHHSIPD